MDNVILAATNNLGELTESQHICPRGDLSLQMLDPMTTQSCGGRIVPDAALVGLTLACCDFNFECRWVKTAGQVDHVA